MKKNNDSDLKEQMNNYKVLDFNYLFLKKLNSLEKEKIKITEKTIIDLITQLNNELLLNQKI